MSVLLPVRNGLPYLTAALASILGQTFGDLELLVIDDGSADGSLDAVRSCADPRVRIVQQRPGGLARALNLGLRESRGAYVARQDADDISMPERLARQVAFLDANPDIDVLATRAAFMGADGATVSTDWTHAVDRQWDRALHPEEIAELMPLTCCIVHGSIMARRDALRAVGGYREELAVAQDYDLWLRMLPQRRIAKFPEALYRYRLHDGQWSASRKADQIDACVRAKLAYLRRVVSLPVPARVRLVGSERGEAVYRRLLGDFHMVESTDAHAWDVTIVTVFSRIDAEYERLTRSLRDMPQRVGNFLVRSAGRRAVG